MLYDFYNFIISNHYNIIILKLKSFIYKTQMEVLLGLARADAERWPISTGIWAKKGNPKGLLRH